MGSRFRAHSRKVVDLSSNTMKSRDHISFRSYIAILESYGLIIRDRRVSRYLQDGVKKTRD